MSPRGLVCAHSESKTHAQSSLPSTSSPRFPLPSRTHPRPHPRPPPSLLRLRPETCTKYVGNVLSTNLRHCLCRGPPLALPHSGAEAAAPLPARVLVVLPRLDVGLRVLDEVGPLHGYVRKNTDAFIINVTCVTKEKQYCILRELSNLVVQHVS